MAQISTLVDDVDGTNSMVRPIDTHKFAVDGDEYEIDLHDENAALMLADFSRWIKVARRVGKKPVHAVGASHKKKGAPVDVEQRRAQRAWLRSQGYEVKDRGIIPKELEALYNRLAHPSSRDTVPAGGRELFRAAQ